MTRTHHIRTSEIHLQHHLLHHRRPLPLPLDLAYATFADLAPRHTGTMPKVHFYRIDRFIRKLAGHFQIECDSWDKGRCGDWLGSRICVERPGWRWCVWIPSRCLCEAR